MNILKKAGVKWIIVSVSVILLVTVGIGTALSYISVRTEPLENALTPGVVACEIQETFEDNVKSDVAVKNTGNTVAYIRVAVVANWQSESNATEILAKKPQQGVDYEIVFGDPKWVLGEDGYWYYTNPVQPEDVTAIFIEKLSPIGDAPEGYSLSVDVFASAIQSMPVKAVETEWGITVKGNTITP